MVASLAGNCLIRTKEAEKIKTYKKVNYALALM